MDIILLSEVNDTETLWSGLIGLIISLLIIGGIIYGIVKLIKKGVSKVSEGVSSISKSVGKKNVLGVFKFDYKSLDGNDELIDEGDGFKVYSKEIGELKMMDDNSGLEGKLTFGLFNKVEYGLFDNGEVNVRFIGNQYEGLLKDYYMKLINEVSEEFGLSDNDEIGWNEDSWNTGRLERYYIDNDKRNISNQFILSYSEDGDDGCYSLDILGINC